VPRGLLEPWMRETVAPLHLLAGSAGAEAALFALAAVCAALLAVGLHTRVAAVLSYVLLISLHARNPLVLNFGDAILRVSLFWALFLPLGRRWSLDELRAGRPPSARPVLSAASAALLLQTCFVYFFTAAEKSGSDWHADGTALYYALNLDWMALPPALWLRQHLALTKLLTWSTLVFEYLGPFLLLAPLWWVRLGGVLGFWALHLGISGTLRLGIFPWVDVAVLSAFLPREVWDALEAAARRALGRDARPAAGADAAEPPPRALGRAAPALVAALLGLLFVENLAGLSDTFRPPERVERAVRALGLEQRWEMFSPDVPRLDGWFLMPGRLADGRLIDLGPHGPALRWTKPVRISAELPSARWGVLLMHQLSNQSSNGTLRRAYARWLCREWNRSHPPRERLERVDVILMLERSVPPGATPTVVPSYLAAHPCPRAGAPLAPGWDAAAPDSGAPPPPLAGGLAPPEAAGAPPPARP
jgi:hypothetical protein